MMLKGDKIRCIGCGKELGGVSYADVTRIAIKEKADKKREGNIKLA